MTVTAAAIRDAGPGSGATAVPLPEVLRRIRAEAQAFQSRRAAREATAAGWRRQLDLIRQSVPSATIEDDGETVRLGELSPGCVACKAGRWDCIFVTMRCNLDCPFCLRPPNLAMPPMYSALGRDLVTLFARYSRAGISGVSFSGGEPFLDPEPVLAWLAALRREFPRLYIWAYTNGLALTPDLLARLADAGLDELRFNMAAAGYRHAVAGRMLREAAVRIPAVAVEIPAIPEQAEPVLQALRPWAEAGVKYLNLHELVYEAGTNSGSMAGARASCLLPDGHACAVNPGSAELIRAVLGEVAAGGLPLAVNDCSLRNKARQTRGRRRMLAPFVLRPHERLCADGTAESACLFNAAQVEFVHPMALDERRGSREGWRAALVRRQLPLDLEHAGQWVGFDLVGEGDVCP